MNAKKCLEILREIKDVAFASVDENGNPQVRIIDVMLIIMLLLAIFLGVFL